MLSLLLSQSDRFLDFRVFCHKYKKSLLEAPIVHICIFLKRPASQPMQ
jgi:hypothetical protein